MIEDDDINKGFEEEVSVIRSHIQELNLDMKFVKMEYKGEDRERQLFVYFTAAKRIDFRELVRRLYTRYRCRIEMRQISVREHAQLIGAGITTCPHSRVPCFIPWCMTNRFGGCFFDKKEEAEEPKYIYKEEE